MRTTFDFAPLYRSSVGFDRVLGLLESAARAQTTDAWPHYDIAKTGEDTYQISMAVAGFSEREITVSTEPNLLVVTGEKETGAENAEFLHRGIATRPFSRRFELADHVKVTSARLVNGLLTIDLLREIPEAMKPRRIEINATAPSAEPARITESRRAA